MKMLLILPIVTLSIISGPEWSRAKQDEEGKSMVEEKTMTRIATFARVKKEGAYTKPDDATLRKMLSPLQYQVTQNNGTEPAFQNEYWDNKKGGGFGKRGLREVFEAF